MSELKRIGRWLRRRPTQRASVNDLINLKLRYSDFKFLLRANNEVLSLIAEIEGRLMDGDVLGTNFFHRKYLAASVQVYKMILHLNKISAGSILTVDGL